MAPRVVLGTLLIVLLPAICLPARVPTSAFAQNEDERDDRLPYRDRMLLASLVKRGMPELVEEMLVGKAPRHRAYVARAHAKAGIDETSSVAREVHYEKAAKEYRAVIALGRNLRWLVDERRRIDLAEWRVEFADMILRHWIAPQLDQYEITSGLEFDSQLLMSRLREAVDTYDAAGKILKDLDIGLRTDEERYLLLGIADRISGLLAQQQVNASWARLYLAMVGGPDGSDRPRLLGEALGAFDLASRSIRGTGEQVARKYNALLGAGIVLRESGRFDEAHAAFDRVLSSTAPPGLTARAHYEKARSLLKARRFEFARRELGRLALVPTDRLRKGESGALFYVRLADLILAFSYMLEARVEGVTAVERKELLGTARDRFEALAARGGSWPRMARIYLDSIAGAKRDLAQLTDAELVVVANRSMASLDYPRAIQSWKILISRDAGQARRHEARFNLAVCYFQTGDVRSAAVAFLEEARSHPPPSIADQVFEYAYRCWRQIAAETESREDYSHLAAAASLLAERLPDHQQAAEAGWVAALALEEAADYRGALREYGRVPRSSSQYWQARRNIARCKQKIHDSLRSNDAASRRERTARRAVEEWLSLAEDLSVSGGGDPASSRSIPESARNRAESPAPPDESVRVRWMHEARLAAASLLVGEDLRDYRHCLDLLGQLPSTGRILGLRMRCLQALGRMKEANRVMEDYLQQGAGQELGALLVGLAAEMESEIKKLERLGRLRQARQSAADSIPMIRHVLQWIRAEPDHARYTPIVQFSLARTMILAGRRDDAMLLLDELMAQYPDNGAYLREAALLQERRAESLPLSDRPSALDEAESLWAKMLEDPSLRASGPEVYWEARYHWLKHQLRHGHANEVVRGIESEKAWYPDLGGRPWRERLLQLAERAEAAIETPTP